MRLYKEIRSFFNDKGDQLGETEISFILVSEEQLEAYNDHVADLYSYNSEVKNYESDFIVDLPTEDWARIREAIFNMQIKRGA